MDDANKKLKRDGGSWAAKIVVSFAVLAVVLPGPMKVAAIFAGVICLVINTIEFHLLRKGNVWLRRLVLVGLPVMQTILAGSIAFTVIYVGMVVAKSVSMDVSPDGRFVLKSLASAFILGGWSLFGCSRTKRILRDADVVALFGEKAYGPIPTSKERLLQVLLSIGSVVFMLSIVMFVGRLMFGGDGTSLSAGRISIGGHVVSGGDEGGSGEQPQNMKQAAAAMKEAEGRIQRANMVTNQAPSPTTEDEERMKSEQTAPFMGIYSLVTKEADTECTARKITVTSSTVSMAGTGKGCSGNATITRFVVGLPVAMIDHTGLRGSRSFMSIKRESDGSFVVKGEGFAGKYNKVD